MPILFFDTPLSRCSVNPPDLSRYSGLLYGWFLYNTRGPITDRPSPKVPDVGSVHKQIKRVSNKDFQELVLNNGEKNLRVAKAYGFRNIQLLIQRLKKCRLQYHYVEVMACPSGCVNGGGQIRLESLDGQRELLQRVKTAYDSAECVRPEQNPDFCAVLSDWLGDLDSPRSRDCLYTSYHAVENTIEPLTMKW